MSQPARINRDSWDRICRRCGRCCYEKVSFQGTVYYTDIPCEHLDPESRLCTVYPHRQQRRKGCIALTPAVVGRGFLPADCPYVADCEDYPAPVLAEDEPS